MKGRRPSRPKACATCKPSSPDSDSLDGWPLCFDRQDLVYGSQQFFIVDRFMEEAVCALVQGPLFVFSRVAAADHYDRNVFGLLQPAQPIYNQKSIPRHAAPVGHIRRETD